MKKIFTITAILLVLLLGIALSTSVNAVNLAENDKLVINDYLGGKFSFKKTYDQENNVTNLDATLTIDESSLAAILAQKPGNGVSYATKGTCYFDIKPILDADSASYAKQNSYFKVDSDVSTAINTIKEELDKEPPVNYTNTYPISCIVLYYKDGQFNQLFDVADGTETIEQQIRTAMNKPDGELVYGTDYKIAMYTNLYWFLGWKYQKNNTTVYDYVKVTYNMQYPVSANGTTGGHATTTYYPSLSMAVEAEETDIEINKDTTVNENVTIPEGVKVTVQNNATLTVSDGSKLTVAEGAKVETETGSKVVVPENGLDNKGTVLGAVKEGTTEKVYSNITSVITGVENAGNISVVGNSVSGATVNVNVSDIKPGYLLSAIKILNANGQDITSTVNYNDNTKEFTMPSTEVKVEAEFKAAEYKFVEGQNQTYKDADLTFKLDGLASLFDSLYVNDKEVEPANYTVKSGSTIVTLKNDYLKTLAAGDYKLKVAYTNGTSAETVFKVAEVVTNAEEVNKEDEKPAEEAKPTETFDGVMVYVTIASIAVIGLVVGKVYMAKSGKIRKH